MKVVFWGTCGSLPSPISIQAVKEKIRRLLESAMLNPPEGKESIERYMESLPFAVRGTFGGNTSCVEIVDGNEFILCDAGTGLRNFGMDVLTGRKSRLPATFHLFISHPHWDHIQGFPFFTPAYMPGNRIIIYGCHDRLEYAFQQQQEKPFFPVPFKSMEADIQFCPLDPCRTHQIAGFKVSVIEQDHPGLSYGYRFEKDGTTVVYSTDSEHRDNVDDESYRFIKFFKEADLLIFDAQYILADSFTHKENWGHSSNIIAVELAARSKVKHLCLYHVEHTYSDEVLYEMLENTRKYRNMLAADSRMEISMAYDGMEVLL